MNRYKNIHLGYYLPSFFFIDIATSEKLENLDNLKDDTKSTLYHEYVHFLQDLTATFGLTNIINNVDIQKAVNKNILESKKSEFETPVSYESFKDVDLYSYLNGMFFGDSESKFSKLSFITTIKLVENGLIPGFEDKTYVEVHFVTNGVYDTLALGAIAVMENMAYLIESSLYDNVNPPEYPYRIIERVVEFIYPEFGENKINIVMLCDYSLNTPDPGRFLVDFIRLLKSKNIKNYEDAYNLIKLYNFSDLTGEEFTIFSLFDKRSTQAKEQLMDYFTIDLYEENNLWISTTLENTNRLRLENYNFWARILEKKTQAERRSEFNLIITKIGFPLLSNSKLEVSFSHPEINPQYIIAFKAIYEVREIIMGKQKECGLKAFCKSDTRDITNESCNTPWDRGKQEPLCPFGQIIKMWGIHEKTPV